MIASLLIVIEVTFQEIRKKENFKDYEHDEQFNKDYQPDLFAPTRKVRKPLSVKPESTFKNIHSTSNFAV